MNISYNLKKKRRTLLAESRIGWLFIKLSASGSMNPSTLCSFLVNGKKIINRSSFLFSAYLRCMIACNWSKIPLKQVIRCKITPGEGGVNGSMISTKGRDYS